ncbi:MULTISPECIES: hypothetical protein [Trichocoleus]|uniref:Uncharacterized protein n=1 Tax=Trichocoleus desertorum GB2-A4 TaxID=2933944 RepID=A0ABV0JII7_9CYAN|nr:hypothetical protein [Trichocoleus sp. FACHB-46]MBD1865283.1 hypothetical protein [Trichocoleus sp. FACHB-46]
MTVLVGECLLSETGHFYRVVEDADDVISLTRVNSFTVIAFKRGSIQTLFRPCACSKAGDSVKGWLPIEAD